MQYINWLKINQLLYSVYLRYKAFTATLINSATLTPFYYQTVLRTLPMRF